MTFAQLVFWVRIAPTITSNGVSPGHQCCGPQAAKRRRYISGRGDGTFFAPPLAGFALPRPDERLAM
jgi:hypothetical protein